jgi:hypothetical protein
VRELWGESLSGKENYLQTVTTKANMIANHRFLTATLRHGRQQNYIFTPQDIESINGRDAKGNPVPITASPEQIKAYTDLLNSENLVPMTDAAKEGKADAKAPMGPLADTMVSKDFKKAMEDIMKTDVDNPWLASLLQFNGMIKMMKTVWSASTQSLNFSSNLGFAVANGWTHHNPKTLPRRVEQALGMTGSEITNRSFKQYRSIAGRAIELQVLGDAGHAGELQRIREESARKSTLRAPGERMAEFGEKYIKGQALRHRAAARRAA